MSVDVGAVIAWMRRYDAVIADQKGALTELDSAIGDADHGTNMDRGMQAVVAKLDGAPPPDVGAALKTVGMTLISTVGGSGGPLYGSFFMQAGNALAGETELTPQELVRALEAGVAGVMKIGKSTTGEKTMLDTLVPAVEALHAAVDGGASLGDALTAACEAGQHGMEATIPMLATKGRASYLGERSIGHQDPGATSSNLLLRTLAESLE